ncbi:dermonecrotic toxin domain-containing protein [Pseudomonas sp. R37(2017)]|uniref:dermonecrotic toxin domain-containing protein n=1 Tax=Pseudomonas sp. R37(2017) TaxID=1981685 RepID=UPI000A1ED3C2|nr:DUF6543 domain-containing protein [Pseudomonas sp. R37(2017)]
MVDEHTPLPSDFGLTRTLPSSLDESLILSASARCNDCRVQWLALMAQDQQSPLTADWWQARAHGTDLSRKAQAIGLYRQHFEASCQLAFAQGTLNTEQINVLLDLVNPTAQATTPEVRVYVEMLSLAGHSGRSPELPGALVITRDTDHPVTQMLYLPSRQAHWMTFDDRNSMERWLNQQQAQLLEQPQSQASNVTISYSVLDKPELSKSAESLLARLAMSAADRQRYATVFASPPDLPMPDANDDIAPFGQLSPDIPFGLRRSAVLKQQSALENLLGPDFPDPNDPRLQRLQLKFDALSAAEQASTDAASALLYSVNAQQLLELRHQPGPHYAALYQARLTGLRAEAELQLSLNQIDSEEHQWITTVLDAPDQARPADRVVARLELSATVSEGDTTTTQTRELDGVLVFARASALLQTATDSLLLYWPGRFGGLQRFASRQAMEQELFKLSANENTQTLQLLPLTRNPFEYALQTQLHAHEQQAARIIADNPTPQRADQRRQALEKLREQALASLTVPIPAARELAYAQLLEQHRSGILAGNLPQWLGTLSEAQRSRLKGLFTAYIEAMKRSHALLERELPPREAFAEKAIDIKLRQDFGLTQKIEVLLDLPDSTYWQKVVMEGAAPGTPQQNMLFASQQRSKLSLAELALGNIDEAMWLRLTFMRVEISGADEAQRQRLQSGISQMWLRALVTELDLAGQYETLIRETFLGSGGASTFSNEHRRECLSEPWRLMLKLQGEFALLQRQISADGHQLLEIAIDANSREAYAANGKRIVLLPANLTAGGEDTPHQGPSTLAGVTFIVEQVSDLTLLYLPDSPDGIFLRQYDTLEEARKALFNLCLHTQTVNYLADRAIHGNFEQHINRINQALLKNHDALIGTGTAWPATTSLAVHLVNVHMGRLLQAHRTTSRSNDALYFERAALKCGALFNYLKMALGMVPFVGSAIALYDAWSSANLAVAAFLRGDVGHGLAEVEAVLMSLIDAAMDIVPGASIGSSPAAAARSLTRVRQLGIKSLRPLRTLRHARQVVERFAGYEYENLISLASLQPGTHGIYRNVYRHADGDFIVRQGRIFQIEWSNDSRNWRLTGTRMKTYKQPIAVDEAGDWDTYFHVHGKTFEGGGLGGGAVLGHLADGLDPLWPAAIRERLPRWWTDQRFRRLQALTEAADNLAPQLDAQVSRTNTLLRSYNSSTIANRAAIREIADTSCITDIEMASRHYQTLVDLLPLNHGSKRRALVEMQSDDALILADRHQQRLYFANHRAVELLDLSDALILRLDRMPHDDLASRLRVLERIRKVRVDFVRELDAIDAIHRDFNLWYEQLTVPAHKKQFTPTARMLTGRLSEANKLYLKTGHLLEVIKRFDTANDISWLYLQQQSRNLRARVDRALFTQFSLPEVTATKAQRTQILRDCLEAYDLFRREMNIWTASYPQHFHLEWVAPLMEGIERMAERARKGIQEPIATSAPGHGNKKIFMTNDDHLLIGVEHWEPTTQTRRYNLTGEGGINEVWEQDTHGKFRQVSPVEQPVQTIRRDLDALLTDARGRLQALDNYKAKVRSYATQDMSPIDLEHMMDSEAAELILRAEAIERLSPTESIAAQLRRRADEMRRAGRTLRIDQSMKSKTPTEGYLDYLLEQKVVDIRKEGGLRDLGKRADGRRDFLQEYEVRDLRSEPAQILWYAHFHYTSAKPQFSDFVKAHLKLPEQRNLGLQWQKEVAASGGPVEAIWRGDIGKPLGNKHFSSL